MRSLMFVAAVLSVSACNRGTTANNSANKAAPVQSSASTVVNTAAPVAPAVPPATTAAGLPDGFPSSDQSRRGAECIVYLGLAAQADSRPGAHDRIALGQAADQWRAGLQHIGGMSMEEIDQLVGSSVNPLSATAAAQRDAAAEWCVTSAPEVDPEN